ncbi:MAG: hypothetical protein ACOCWC_06075 [Bacteroidota bacterium]
MHVVSESELLNRIFYLSQKLDECNQSGEEFVEKHNNEIQFIKNCRLKNCTTDEFVNKYFEDDETSK